MRFPEKKRNDQNEFPRVSYVFRISSEKFQNKKIRKTYEKHILNTKEQRIRNEMRNTYETSVGALTKTLLDKLAGGFVAPAGDVSNDRRFIVL